MELFGNTSIFQSNSGSREIHEMVNKGTKVSSSK